MNIVSTSTKNVTLSNTKIVFYDNEKIVLDELKEDFKYHSIDIENFHFTTIEEEVFSIIKTKGIDIVVSDFIMPNKDGITLLEEIRKLSKEIILVLRTAYVVSFKSSEKERCRNSRIELLSKHEGFEYLCANLLRYLKSKMEEKENLITKPDVAKPAFESSFPFQARLFEFIIDKLSFIKINEAQPYHIDDEWHKVTEVPAKVLKILHDKVQCECLISASLKRTQIREFPLIMFSNIYQLQENKYVNVKVKLKPGFSCTEIIDASNLHYEQYFELDGLDELNDLVFNKLQ